MLPEQVWFWQHAYRQNHAAMLQKFRRGIMCYIWRLIVKFVPTVSYLMCGILTSSTIANRVTTQFTSNAVRLTGREHEIQHTTS